VRILGIDELEAGMLVGRTLYDKSGRILLQSGVPLSNEYIAGLRAKGFRKLLIRDAEVDEGIEWEEDVSEEVRARAVSTLREAFDDIEAELTSVKNESAQKIADAFDSDHIKALLSKNGPLARLHSIVGELMDDVLTRSTLAGLTSMKSSDDALLQHSIDVCAIALMVAKALGQPDRVLRQLATGCLLHDIVKMFISPEMPERYAIKQHTTLGYELLKRSEDRDILAPHVAFEHHEHQDGTGLPRGLKGSNSLQRNRAVNGPVPTLIGEIAAVADAYENLITGTAKRPGMTPDVAIRHVREDAGSIYNKAVVTAFFRVVPVYPVGMQVILRHENFNNCTAVVMQVNSARLDRPLVRIFLDKNGKRIKPLEVDLATLDDSLQIRPKMM